MKKDTGGPAFMVAELANIKHDGMSLRDYFAAKAMQEWVGACDPKEGSIRAYEWADAMLKAREQ